MASSESSIKELRSPESPEESDDVSVFSSEGEIEWSLDKQERRLENSKHNKLSDFRVPPKQRQLGES